MENQNGALQTKEIDRWDLSWFDQILQYMSYNSSYQYKFWTNKRVKSRLLTIWVKNN